MKQNIEKYIDEIIIHEQHIDGYPEIVINKEIQDKYLNEDEATIILMFSTMMNYMNKTPNAEIMDMAVECLKELKEAGKEFPRSTTFLNSLFNFDNAYEPLYDLLDLATNGRYKGEKMSSEYRKGIVDSIVALRRFQRTHGFGDHEWEIDYNTAIMK